MTDRMWNTPLRIEEDEQMQKSKMLHGRYQVKRDRKRSGSKNANGDDSLG